MSWESTLDEQIDLKRWWGTPEAQTYSQGFIDSLTHAHPEDGSDIERTYGSINAIEERKLHLADPVWISPDVCKVIDAARQADPPFKPEPLLPSDLPCQYGFMRFHQPMHLTDARGKIVNVAAVAWAPITDATWEGPGSAPWDRQGIDVTLYSDLQDEDDEDLEQLRMDRFGSRFVLLHHMPWWFGKTLEEMHFTSSDWGTSGPETIVNWFTLFQISLRIMQQKITASGKSRLPRAFRRRAERAGFDPFTVVVTLRRYEKSGRTGEGYDGDENFYSHRFIVRGFWRAQWYPSAQEHRQLYIHDFIKGPADAELIVKPSRAIEVVR